MEALWFCHDEVGEDNTIHVWPQEDTIEHNTEIGDKFCPCLPLLEEREDGAVIVTHRDDSERQHGSINRRP